MGAVPVVLVDERFWRGLINWDAFVAHGMIEPADLGLVRFAEDAEAAWHLLDAAGVRLSA
jgi:predicted Rossmann-fold nucleotide-binding protein